MKNTIGASEASRIIGVSLPTVHAWRKKMGATLNELGNWTFERSKVLEFAKWYRENRPRYRKVNMTEGQKAALAVKSFDCGLTVTDVVAELQVTPELAKKWFQEWRIDRRMEVREDKDPKLVRTQLDLEIKRTQLQIKKANLEAARERKRKAKKQNDRMEQRDWDEIREPDDGPPLVEQFRKATGK